MSQLPIAALQTDIVWENPSANFEKLAPRIAAAAAAGSRLIVLPEMFACGFSMDTENIREAEDGPSSQFLKAQALKHKLWITGSVPELPSGAEKPYNTLVLASPEGQLYRYRKIHPFTFAGEHEHYEAGTDFFTLEIEGLRCTFFVCYDLRFADEFWATAHDTDLYVVVANWPVRRREHWRTLLRARAIENQSYVIGVNRVGQGSGLQYVGDSAVIDPWGECLCEGRKDETTLLATIDARRVADARRIFPVLPDRRER